MKSCNIQDLATQLKALKNVNLEKCVMNYHIPNLYRKVFTTISKEQVAMIIGKQNPVEFGFKAVDGGKFYEVSEFEENDQEPFRLDADRIQKLTKIIKFLETK